MTSEVNLVDYGWSTESPHTEANLLRLLSELLESMPPPQRGFSTWAAATAPWPSRCISWIMQWW